ncbi:DUF2306 domain-containing protein [Allonocardiopsis opalescens]|uniref:Putative membrane protein n=1 Tax=Allonocardiopsis opalescens TaxID=1144618 RepID=A0A2T0PYR3_9ACTN|nr:DUF2306 domain-containing protein [Allonocardiopsis opalescens]PRX96685.1 putative membrane protein [Allonocardiopsis opalescens]
MTEERTSAGRRPPGRAGRRGRTTPADWLIPAGLLLLSAVPAAGGVLRLTDLAGGELTPENARFVTAPLPVVVHAVSATVYCVLGAFQFVPAIRRRRPGWHRAAGRLLVPCGLAAALTGLWMTLTYSFPAIDGELLAAFRLLFGSAMALFIVLGLAAVRRRDFARHRAWMIRGYAIGLGAGTQAFTPIPWLLLVGPPGETGKALLMAAAWVINLAVAELIIRWPSRPHHLSAPDMRRPR